MPDPEVVRLMRKFRADLLAQEREQMAEMTRRWLQVERRLDANMAALAFEIDSMRQRGEEISQARLFRLARFRSLLDQVRDEVGQYNDWATGLIMARQLSWLELGIDNSAEAIRATGVRTAFDMLPVSQVQYMAGMVRDGTPLGELLKRRSLTGASDGLGEALVRAIGLGWNPRKTARAMRDGLAQGMQKALVIARSEQMRVYREASRQQYIRSGVVTGYKRIAARQLRTCLACLFSDGRVYRLEQSFEDHPSGRCSLVPITIGMPDLAWKTGREWFGELSPDRQAAMMGARLHSAWKTGKVTFDDIIRTHRSDVWGNHLRPATLGELGLA